MTSTSTRSTGNMNSRDLKSIVREEIDRIIEKKGPGARRPPQATDKILPDHDTDSKIYGASTFAVGLDVDGKPNNPKKLGAHDVYKREREKKQEEAYLQWAIDVRGRAYVEYREPPQ